MHWLWTIPLLTLCFSGLNSSSDCFDSENIECTCDTDSVKCTGIQQEHLELQDLLVNISSIYASRDLLYLDLNIKNLTFPPGFTFKDFKLQNLTIGTDLENIQDDIFSGLSSSLTSIHLFHNNMPFINNQPFSKLYNLKELKLDSNEIHNINSNTFFNLSNLQYLSLSGNKLYQMDDSILEHLPAIQEIVLSNNNLSSISNINIVSSTLKVLHVQNCSINGSVITEFLSGVTNLENSDFSSNKLTGVESYAMASLKQLKSLNLSNNQLEKLEHNAFSSLYNLRSLDLKNNKLLHITKTSFLNLTNLQYLDLSGNLLEVVLGEYTSDLYSLESINLKSNNIKIIMAGTFSTSISLKKLSLLGNSWDCICELSNFVSFLLNNSHVIEIEDIDELKCASPHSLKGTSLTNIDFTPLNCDNKEETEDYDYGSSETPSTEDGTTVPLTSTIVNSTTELMSTTNSSFTDDTTLLISLTTEEIVLSTDKVSSTTKEIHSSTQDLSSTTDINPITQEISSTTEVPSTTQEISTTTEAPSITQEISSTSEIQLTTQAISSTTEVKLSTTEISSTTEGQSTTQENTSDMEVILLSTKTIGSKSDKIIASTENKDLTSQSSSVQTMHITSTTTPVPKVTPELSVKILEYFVKDKEFCLRWSLSGSTLDSKTCSISLHTIEGRKSKSLKCPTDGNEVQQCLLAKEVYEFCINIYVKTMRKSKVCNKIPVLTTAKYTTEVINVSSESTSTSLYTTQVSETTKKGLYTTEKPKPSLSGPVAFKVVAFDVFFNYSNFSALLKWRVTKTEPESRCNLTLIFTTYHYNHTEGVFECSNNTHQMVNIKEQDPFKICLMITHDQYKTNLICKSHNGLSYELKASQTKDDGYKNSSLIAVICLLIVFVLVVMIFVAKKLLKKRIEADRYNVYEQEQNVKRRISSQYPQEPCVRYSYTMRECNKDI